MHDIEKIRAIPLGRILKMKEGREYSIRCVFPNHNDNSPSLRIYRNNGYHCFGCGANGQNAIDFALHVNGCVDPRKAMPQEVKRAIEDLIDYL